MCGICGYTGPAVRGLTQQMLDRIQHRGPDDRGTYDDDQIHLGMVRLSIIDLAGGRQPMSNEDGTVHVVFNGEIYNYLELRQELEQKGHRFSTRSDTETIVHGYEEYGTSVTHKLNGMFSIALWDSREQTLFLMRDRFGIKPLFYSHLPDTFVFGSEIKALLCHPNISKDLDYQALSHYLSLRNVPAPLTIFKDIRVLLPGHLLKVNSQARTISRWYEPSMTPRWDDSDEDQLVEQIDSYLRASVRLRLRSDVAFGAYLSGGIDSSTVVAIMSEYCSQPVKTFCLTYADAPQHKTDAYHARILARRYSTEHHECVMDWTDLKKDLPAVLAHLDQPFAGVISSFWLSRFMRQYVTVALSGDGADDMFGSYGHHRLVWPIASLRSRSQGDQSLGDLKPSFASARNDLILDLSRYRPWEWRLAYGAFMEHEKQILLSRLGQDQLIRYSTAEWLKETYQRPGPEVDDLNRMLYLDINSLLPNEILYYNDMLSMANSMEVRTPFLDFRVVELACSIPGTLKIRGRTLKYILRKVASRYVPPEILERPKEGFVLPKNTWLRQGMAPMVQHILSADRLRSHGLFEPDYVHSLVSRFVGGDESLTYRLWTLMVFQIWYESYWASTARGEVN